MRFTAETEGVDHINAYSQSKTELGAMLSNFAHLPINTEDGAWIWQHYETRAAQLRGPEPRSRVMHIRAWSGPRGDDAVYIGRSGHGEDGYFGNPARVGGQCPVCTHVHKDGASTLGCFETYARKRLTWDEIYRERVRGLRGKVLLCFCAPRPCHGDVLARLAEELHAESTVDPTLPVDAGSVTCSLIAHTTPGRGEGCQMIQKVSTTFNGAPRSYELGARTLVIGPTGSGKSTLLASLGLLLTNRADDVVGKDDVASGADLALAMAEGQEEIAISGDSGDGSTWSWKMERGHKPHLTPEGDAWNHPVREIERILDGGADKARVEFAPLLLGNDPVAVRRLVAPQIAEMLPESMTVDEIIAKREESESTAKAMGKRIDIETKALDTTERALPTRPDALALKAARDTMSAAQARAEESAHARGAWEVLDRRVKALAQAYQQKHARAIELSQEYQALASVPVPEQQQAEPAPGLTAGQRKTLEAYAHLASVAEGEACPICRSPMDVQTFKATIEAHLAHDQKLRQEHAARTLTVVPSRTVEQVRSEYEAAAAELSRLAAEHQAATAELSACVVPEPGVDASQIQQVLLTLQSAEDAWERHTKARAELMGLQEQHAKLKLVADGLKRLVDSVYRERIALAEAGVNRWLPKGYGMQLLLATPSGARTFRLGLKRPDGVVATNPSGGQRSALILAIATYLVEKERIAAPTPVVMLAEERGFSPAWLGKVLRALEDAPCQVVIVSLLKPTGYRGKAWSTLTLEDQEGREQSQEQSQEAEGAGASGETGTGNPVAEAK